MLHEIDTLGGGSACAYDVGDSKWDKTFLRGDAPQKDYLIHRYRIMKSRSNRLLDRFYGNDCFYKSGLMDVNGWRFQTHGGLFRLGGIEWKSLDNEIDSLFTLVAAKSIGELPYADENCLAGLAKHGKPLTWESSTICRYLNGPFLERLRSDPFRGNVHLG